MIAIDTNVLVRMIIEEGQQTEQARRLIEEAHREKTRVVITSIVLVEAIWTLRRRYRFDRREIATFVGILIRNPLFVFPERDAIKAASYDYLKGKADFSDYLIAAQAERAGALIAYSFDIAAVKSGRFCAMT